MKYIPYFFGFIGLALLMLAAEMYFDIPSSNLPPTTITNTGTEAVTITPIAGTINSAGNAVISLHTECTVTERSGEYRISDCHPVDAVGNKNGR